MNALKVEINDKLFEVVYIEYHDKIPHSVIVTGSDIKYRGYRTEYDFEIMYGDRMDIRFKWCGSGGRIDEIQAPKYVAGTTGVEYWMREDAKFKGNPDNISRIDRPHRIKAQYGFGMNPFKVCLEADNIEYCSECNENRVDECPQHQYWDDKSGCVRYISNNEEA